MGDPRTEKYKTVATHLNEILYEDWAPIDVGGLPRDEYASYVSRAISLLASGATESEIASYLCRKGEAIAGCAYPEERSLAVARKLMSYREAVNAIPR